MSAVIDRIAPPRLGRGFRWLLTSNWVSNLGDGIAVSVGPLLIASLTRNPVVVALASTLVFLPWLLFGLVAGAVADRYDRRRIVSVLNLVRAVVLALLAVTIATDTVTIEIVLVSMFLVGVAETFADSAGGALLPMLVPPDDLGIANARLIFGSITINRLIGPPLGALLFAAGMASPIVVQAVCMVGAAAFVIRIPLQPREREIPTTNLRGEIGEGLRWLWANRPVRLLTITVTAFNITFGATLAIMVLYATDELDFSAVGYGVLTASAAAGGIVGTILYGWMERRIGAANIMRVGLVVETGMHLAFALNRTQPLALAVMFLFGLHEASWSATNASIRQRLVPDELQGRVTGTFLVGVFGSLVIGSLLGGAMADRWGLRGPFWFGFVGSAMILVTMWRSFGDLPTTTGVDGGRQVAALG